MHIKVFILKNFLLCHFKDMLRTCPRNILRRSKGVSDFSFWEKRSSFSKFILIFNFTQSLEVYLFIRVLNSRDEFIQLFCWLEGLAISVIYFYKSACFMALSRSVLSFLCYRFHFKLFVILVLLNSGIIRRFYMIWRLDYSVSSSFVAKFWRRSSESNLTLFLWRAILETTLNSRNLLIRILQINEVMSNHLER